MTTDRTPAPSGVITVRRPAPPDAADPSPFPTGGAAGSPFPSGAASGIGSLPGTDIAEAVAAVLGELPDLPHLPELPARGPGADLIGRSAGFLVGLPVELYAARWRTASRTGRDARRTADLLERDLDQLTERADGYAGPLKIASAGPWTLAANLQLPIGGALLRDRGAVRELGASLAEGLAAHVADVRRRVPGASVLLQLDEPALPTVLAGRVPTESGLGTLRAVDEGEARALLADVIKAAGVPVVTHCCAGDPPVALLRAAGAAAVALDVTRPVELDPLGEAIDAGLVLFAGALPTDRLAGGAAPGVAAGSGAAGGGGARTAGGRSRRDGTPPGARAAEVVTRLWHDLGFPRSELPDRVVVTPACGLAGASWPAARAIMKAVRDAAARLVDAAHT